MTADELIFPTLISLVATSIVFFGNINIILATIRYKSLQHPCHYLIAFNALADIGSHSTHLVFSFYLFSGNLYTTRQKCIYWQIIPTSAGMWGLILTLAIGFDRMIGVVIPLRYRQLKSASYVSALVFLSILFTTCIASQDLLYNLSTPNDTVICFVTSTSHPGFVVARNIIQSIICGLIFTVYSITWLTLLIKKNGNKNLKQILKALTIIMIVVVFTWPLIILLVNLSRQFIPHDQTLTVILYIVWLKNFGSASNYFIFLAFSQDYRKAFLRQLPFVPFFKKKFHPKVYIVQNAFMKVMNSTQHSSTRHAQ